MSVNVKKYLNQNLYLFNLPNSRYVYLDIIALAGIIFEGKFKMGIAHLLEHYIVNIVNSQQNKIKIEGAVNKEHIFLWAKINKRLFFQEPEAIFKLLDLIFHLPLNSKIFEIEKKRVIEEVRILKDDLDYQVNYFCLRERFKNKCAYSKSPLENEKAIKNINFNDLKKFYNFYFRNQETKTVIGLNQAQNKNFVPRILSYMQNRALNKSKIKSPKCEAYSNLKIKVGENRFLTKDYLIFSFPGLSSSSSYKKRIALNIFCKILLDKLRNKSYDRYFNHEIVNWKKCGIVLFKFCISSRSEDFLMKIIKDFLEEMVNILNKISYSEIKKIIREIKLYEKIQKNADFKYEHFIDSLINNKNFLIRDIIYDQIMISDILSVAKRIFDINYLNLFILKKKISKIDKKRIQKIIELVQDK